MLYMRLLTWALLSLIVGQLTGKESPTTDLDVLELESSNDANAEADLDDIDTLLESPNGYVEMESGGDSEVEADVDLGDDTEGNYTTDNKMPTEATTSPVEIEQTTGQTTEPTTEHRTEHMTEHTTTTHSPRPITTPNRPVTSTYITEISTHKPAYTTNPVTGLIDGHGESQHNDLAVTIFTTTPDASPQGGFSVFLLVTTVLAAQIP